jgi:two-component system phosphate regulon sensor histidine kinase PhoR
MAIYISKQHIYHRLIISLVIALFLGWLFDAIWLYLFIATLGNLIWHTEHIGKLSRWLWQSQHLSPPKATGIWGFIFDALYQRNKKFRQRLKKLQRQTKEFRDGAEALPDAALVINNALTITWANKKVEALLGIQPKKDIGQRIDNLIRLPAFTTYIQQEKFKQPCQIPSPINEHTQLELRFVPYDDQILVLIRDISQTHRMNTMRRDFVANVSHELKTPLTVIRGYVEYLQTDELMQQPRIKKTFTAMEAQVNRMNHLVEQLLELSKIEVNENINLQPLMLDKLIRIILSELEWLIREKQQQIKLQLEDNVTLIGNEAEIKSALSNLIINAIHYTPEQGDISISCSHKQHQIIFTVKDNGPGIKAKHIPRLTERFYRVDDSRSRNTGGSGLGLAIVKHVVQHHQAQLIIQSVVGKGSEFSIIFPNSSPND